MVVKGDTINPKTWFFYPLTHTPYPPTTQIDIYMLIIKKNNTKEGKRGGKGSKANDERRTAYKTKETKGKVAEGIPPQGVRT